MQRQVQDGPHDQEFSDLRPTRPQACQRDVGLDAGCGEAIVDLAVFRVLQRDVVQGQVERGPDADPDPAIDREPVAGLALDPLLDRRGEIAGGNADHGQQCDHDNCGGDGGPGNLQCFHFDIQTAQRGRIRPRPSNDMAGDLSLSRNGTLLQRCQNILRLLQSYVTYATLPRG
jgi:hypothetical protein